MKNNRQNQITGKVLAQNVMFFALVSIFVAFGLTLLFLWIFVGIPKLDSMPKHEGRTMVVWVYGVSWLLSVIALSLHRFVQLFNYRDRENITMTVGLPRDRNARCVAWRRKGFFTQTYFLMDGTNKLYTLERKGDEAVMYNESVMLRIDAKQVVTDEATGQQLATADLKVEQLMRAATNAGSIRCADGAIYTVGFTEGKTHLKAQDGAKFISIQGGTMVVGTNESVLDKKVAALCLVLSSFLVLGEFPWCS